MEQTAELDLDKCPMPFSRGSQACLGPRYSIPVLSNVPVYLTNYQHDVCMELPGFRYHLPALRNDSLQDD